MTERIPSETDWRSEVWCLDAESAYKRFAGKTLDEAIELFVDNAIKYQEAVMFMPAACLPFYGRAYIEYLFSDAAKGDSDGASPFFGLVEIRAKEIAADAFFASLVEKMLRHLATHQEWYDAEESIYGSFAKRAERTLALLQRHSRGDKTTKASDF